MSNLMQKYFRSQPQVLKTVMHMDLHGIDTWAAENAAKETIHLVGAGSSYYMACAAKPLFERYADVKTAVTVPTTDLSVDTRDKAYILVSQEGKSVNTFSVADQLHRKGYPFALVTAMEDSPTAGICSHLIPVPCGKEACGPKTMGVTGTYLVLALMAIELGCTRGRITACTRERLMDEMKNEAESAESGIAACEKKYDEIADQFRKSGGAVIISSRSVKPFADEGALKIIETLYRQCSSYEVEEFVHGPNCLIGTNNLFIGLLDGGKDDERIAGICAFAAETGSPSFCISSNEMMQGAALYLKGSRAFPLHFLFPFQMIAARLSEELSHDLDTPRFSDFSTRFGSKL